MLLVIFFIILIIFLWLLRIKLYLRIENNKLTQVVKFTLLGIPFFKIHIKTHKKVNSKKQKGRKVIEIIKDIVKKKKLYIETLRLQISISTTDSILTAFTVFGVSTVITVLFKSIENSINKKNFKYSINPIYSENKIFDIDLYCIISGNLANIISVITQIKKEMEM